MHVHRLVTNTRYIHIRRVTQLAPKHSPMQAPTLQLHTAKQLSKTANQLPNVPIQLPTTLPSHCHRLPKTPNLTPMWPNSIPKCYPLSYATYTKTNAQHSPKSSPNAPKLLWGSTMGKCQFVSGGAFGICLVLLRAWSGYPQSLGLAMMFGACLGVHWRYLGEKVVL